MGSVSAFIRATTIWFLTLVLLAACGGGGGGATGPATGGVGPGTPAPIASPKAFVYYSLANVTGTINETNKTIAVTVPFGTNVTALVATFSITGDTVSVGGTPQASGITANNFTNPVTYTVTGLDGTTANYIVTVTVAPSSAKAITAYSFPGWTGVINEANKSVSVSLPSGTNVASLVATFATTGASVSIGGIVQTSGTSANNFTNPVTYTVSAADGSTVNYTVTVTLIPPATIGGTVNGLATANSIGLLDNGVDNLTVAANGAFTFAQTVNYGSAYNVTIGTQPTGQPCTQTYGAGTVFSASINNVDVICGPAFVGTFTVTGNMTTAREQHTSTLLQNGKVLVAGGYDAAGGGGLGAYLATANLYDPVAGTWATTGNMVAQRSNHTATLLPNGKVLVVGGYTNAAYGTYLNSAELYDPATGAWTATGSMANPRSAHTATLLPNGKVLVTGGNGNSLWFQASAELYDPATGTWTQTGTMSVGRSQQTATLLPNGKVLVAGGWDGFAIVHYSGAELYDPGTGVWTATGSMATARENHAATLLPNGKVLVSGGVNATNILGSAELYDPATGTWGATGSMATTRLDHKMILLPTGKVIAVGGQGLAPTGTQGAHVISELYDPATGTWATTGSMATPRLRPRATLLASGKLLVTGGDSFAPYNLANTELFW